MKNNILIGLIGLVVVGAGVIFFGGNNNKINKSHNAVSGEIDLQDPELNPEEPLYGGKCLITFCSMIAQENLDPEDREWEGYHGLGGDTSKKIPTRMLFSKNGNIKMYTKPIEIEGWQLVKDFNVDRMRVPTEDENVDDIIEFPKAADYCLFEDTEENASKDFPCITLYPENVPIQENSPFNVNVCINDQGSITVKMLKNTFYFSM